MNRANPQIQAMSSYSPPLEGRSDYEGILLDFNERSTPPSKKVIGAMTEFLEKGSLNRYPEYSGLSGIIGAYADVPSSSVLVTNGSDQGIELVFRTFTGKNDRVIIPEPSFAMFFQMSALNENRILKPRYLSPRFEFPFREVMDAISPETRLVVLCNPNNPTGTLIPPEEIEAIVQKTGNGIVLVDEAYYEFSESTAVPLLKKYENLIITRTFSKAFGLAGIRAGYLLADKKIIRELIKVRGPYDVNALVPCAVSAVLKYVDDMKKYACEVMDTAKPLVEKYFRSKGISFGESRANFLLFRPDNTGKAFAGLRQSGILTRPMSSPLLRDYLRITIGLKSDMEKFIAAYDYLLSPRST